MAKGGPKIFLLGYPDNRTTQFIFSAFIQNEVPITGMIIQRMDFISIIKRFWSKCSREGLMAALRRASENLFIRRKQIAELTLLGGCQVFYVEKHNSLETRDILEKEHCSLLLLASAPILRPVIVDIPNLLILNAHPGWLPKYRGLDANLKAIRDGHLPAVSVHRVTTRIDAGDVYLRETFIIDTAVSLLEQLEQRELEVSARLLIEAAKRFHEGRLTPITIGETLGKYEPKLPLAAKRKIVRQFKMEVKS